MPDELWFYSLPQHPCFSGIAQTFRDISDPLDMAVAVAVLVAVDVEFGVEAAELFFDFLATSDAAEVEFGEGVLGVGGEGATAVGELAGHI